jgi:hypothetical protein
MIRPRLAFAATLVGASFICAPAHAAQNPQNPPAGQQPMQSILAGKKFTPPVKGQADIELMQPVTKRDKDMVITKIVVKNVSQGPIARLTVDETWYGKDGSTVAGGKGVVNGLLQPGEVKTIEIQTPWNAKMNANNWNFSHANGTVKPRKVKSIEDPNAKKEPAAKTASAKKK